MTCPRCAGLMVEQEFHGLTDDAAWAYAGWRCLCCGNIVDEVIACNRSHPPGEMAHNRRGGWRVVRLHKGPRENGRQDEPAPATGTIKP